MTFFQCSKCDKKKNECKCEIPEFLSYLDDPSTVYELRPGQVQMLLSGHTHGGQIRLPGLGCIWANDRIPVGMARGLHYVNGTVLHVNAGLGVSPPIRLRLFCPPEISIITLRDAKAGSPEGGVGVKNEVNLCTQNELALEV